MQHLLIVMAGGAVGAGLRHLVGLTSLRLFGSGFPIGTLTVNVLGCFLLGVFVELLALRLSGSASLRLLIATGLLGGFTTFSAFSLDVALLWERGAVGTAAFYLSTSVILSVLAMFAGLAVVRHLT
jgi:CrcB protein